MNSQMNSNEINEQFIINYLVEMSHTKRVQLLKKVSDKLCNFNDIDYSPSAAPNTHELKPEPESKIEEQQPSRIGNMIADDYTHLGICPETDEYNMTLGKYHRYLVLLKSVARVAKNKKYAFIDSLIDEFAFHFVSCTENEIYYVSLNNILTFPNNIHWFKNFRKDWKKTINSIMQESNDDCPQLFDNVMPVQNRLVNMKLKFAEFQNREKHDIINVLPRYLHSYNRASYELKLHSFKVEIHKTIEILKKYQVIAYQHNDCPCCLESTNFHTKCNHPLCGECYSNLRLSRGKLPCPLCRTCLVATPPMPYIYPDFE